MNNYAIPFLKFSLKKFLIAKLGIAPVAHRLIKNIMHPVNPDMIILVIGRHKVEDSELNRKRVMESIIHAEKAGFIKISRKFICSLLILITCIKFKIAVMALLMTKAIINPFIRNSGLAIKK
jgi:hypothetical protein